MALKTENRSQRYDINRLRTRHRHWHGHEKLSNTGWVEKTRCL